MAGNHRIAAYQVTLDGKDLTARIKPRLISLSLTEKRGDEADQLDLVIDDADGKMALPAAGAVIVLQLGWTGEPLVNKGSFKVDEVEYEGTPDKITVRARAADFTADLRVRKERSFKATTLGKVAEDVAGHHKLKAKVAPELASIEVEVLHQSRESDLSMLKRLGRKHDAVATIKHGVLILSPRGASATPSGRALPALALTRQDGDQHHYAAPKREAYTGVTAHWHDVKSGKKKSHTAGDPSNAKRLRKTHHTEHDAKTAAESEHKRQQRAQHKFSYTLARGRPDIYPERPVTLKGWKQEIDALPWIVDTATHALDGSGGLTTTLDLETGPKSAAN